MILALTCSSWAEDAQPPATNSPVTTGRGIFPTRMIGRRGVVTTTLVGDAQSPRPSGIPQAVQHSCQGRSLLNSSSKVELKSVAAPPVSSSRSRSHAFATDGPMHDYRHVARASLHTAPRTMGSAPHPEAQFEHNMGEIGLSAARSRARVQTHGAPGAGLRSPQTESPTAPPYRQSGTGSGTGAGTATALLLARFADLASTDRVDLGEDRLGRDLRVIRATQV
jgi:hypothetical protein